MAAPQLTPFNMPRKKKDTTPELELKFTGKMSILIEQENHGPIEWRDIDEPSWRAGARRIRQREPPLDRSDSSRSQSDRYLSRLYRL